MKKLLGSFIVSVLLIGCCFIMAFAEDIAEPHEDFEYYTTSNGEAMISKYIGSGGDVTIPSEINGYRITDILAASFLNCDNVTAITIPDGIRNISGAFQQCKNLVHVTLPNSITNIDSAFMGCSSLAEINIPNGVTSIGTFTFSDCTSLTDLIIPEGVISIGRGAFLECSNLTNITVPNSISYIGESAFWGCGSLTEITIPESVTSIGAQAFQGCSSIVEAVIPKNVTHIRSSAFANCTNLKTVYYNAINCNKDTHQLFTNCPNLNTIIIGDEVKTIPMYAFAECTGLTKVSLSEEVDYIGTCAFQGCINLEEITIPQTITFIGEKAFQDCCKITEVIIPENAELKQYAFAGCTNLETVYYNTIYTAASDIFSGCNSISKLVFGDNVEYIPCFENCLITEITIPKNVTIIDDFAFRNCKNLGTIYYSAQNCLDVSLNCFSPFTGCINISKVVFGNNVESIPDYLFAFNGGDPVFSEVIIPESVTSIGIGAFSGCDNLTNVTISEGVVSIGDEAFAWCGFTNIIIPESIVSIGAEAFRSCPLINITIPQSVISIGKKPFDNCIHLTSISVEENNPAYISVNGILFNKEMTELIQYPSKKELTEYKIPDSVTNIAGSAFAGCRLTSVTIPNSVTDIERGAFGYCHRLTTITIPAGVTSIGDSAFSMCDQLTDIFVAENNPNYISIDGVLFNREKTELIQYPFGKVQPVYIIPSGVISFKYSAFRGCRNLTSIAIPNGVTNFEVLSFANCDNLTSVAIPDSITYMDDWIFDDDITIYSTPEAYAHQYAREKNLKWADISTYPYRTGTAIITDIIMNDNLLTVTLNLQTESTFMIGTLFAGIYNDTGSLIKMLPTQTIMPEKTEYVFDITGISSDSKIKVFAWRDLSSLSPLCEAKEYSPNPVYIPDSLLKQHINKALSPDRIPDRTITKSEMESLTYLYINDNISNLEGLQYAKNLEYLYLMDTGLAEIADDIFTSMLKLKQLALWSDVVEFENSLTAIQKLQAVNKNVSVCLDRDLMNVMILPQYWDINGLSLSCPEKYTLWDLGYAIEQANGNWGLSESQIEAIKNLDFTSVKLVDYWEENYKDIVEQNPNTSMQNPADLYTIEPSLKNNFDFTNGPIQFRVSLKRNPNIYLEIIRGFTKYPDKRNDVVVTIGDEYIRSIFDTHSGRILVSMTDFADCLNISSVIDSSQIIMLYDKNTDVEVKMEIGSFLAHWNNREIILDSPPQYIGNQVYIPLRFVTETLNLEVEWSGEILGADTSTVIIKKQSK